jgi:hypothetical protein
MKHTTQLRTRLTFIAATGLLVITAGCSSLPSNMASHAPQLEHQPAVRLDPARVNELIGSQGGLCSGKDGLVAVCASGPRPKWDIDQIKVQALVDLSQLQPGDRPDYVICRINYKQQPPKWECAEIYKGIPR